MGRYFYSLLLFMVFYFVTYIVKLRIFLIDFHGNQFIHFVHPTDLSNLIVIL